MHRNHVMNTLTYENYCLKAKIQELLEKIAKLQSDIIGCGTSYHLQGEHPEQPDDTHETKEEPDTELRELREQLNQKLIEIEYLKELVESLSQKSAQTEKPDTLPDPQIAELQNEISALQQSLYATRTQLQITESNAKEIVQHLQAEIEMAKKLLSQKDDEKDQLKTILAGKDDEKDQLKTILAGKDAEIAHLKANLQ